MLYCEKDSDLLNALTYLNENGSILKRYKICLWVYLQLNKLLYLMYTGYVSNLKSGTLCILGWIQMIVDGG